MLLLREVLYCRPGKVGELAGKFTALGEVMTALGHRPFRLYTDVSGERFWTLVLESEHESLEAASAMERQVMGDPRAAEIMADYHNLVESGRREIYRAVA